MRHLKRSTNSTVGGFILSSFIALLGACAPSDLVIEGSVPVPMIKKIPVQIGVYYPDAFRNFVHTETSEEIGDWQIDLGKQNADFFRSLFGSMFVEAVAIEKWGGDTSDGPIANTQAVLVPRIKKYGFLTPFVSGLGFYSASIEYELTLYDDRGAAILSWAVVGYGKSEGKVFAKEEAVEQATLLAIRDAGARIAIEFAKQKAFKSWFGKLVDAESGEKIEPL
ncbi:MAG: hypothetical protein VXZ77_03645 [Pseudomonadota bacterium]|nr:hypothetical protein [Pseudomonadota bacterium]